MRWSALLLVLASLLGAAAETEADPLSYVRRSPKLSPELAKRVKQVTVVEVLTTRKKRRERRYRDEKLVAFVRKLSVSDSYDRFQLRQVDCEDRDGHASHDCVAVIGDACVAHPEPVDCEGFDLTVVVDLSHERARLDRAVAGFGRTTSLDTILAAWEDAP